MDDKYLLRVEHIEYVKRMEDEHHRQNARLKELEDEVKQYGELTNAVSQLAMSVEQMCRSLEAHNKRLEILESRDGDMWRKVTSYAITAIVGGLVAYVFVRLGLK